MNIRGHTSATSYLERLVSGDGPIPSCFLFHGPAGVGKRTLALSLAKRLNCREAQEASCSCVSCRKIDGGHHLDVRLYEPDGSTFKIDQVRDLLHDSDRPRTEGQYRVFILEGVHLLNAQSGDALLKTLEDGRENVVFILLARSKKDVVSTLVSRSMAFYTGLLSTEDVLDILEENEYRGSEAERAAHLSSGSVEKALFYLEGPGFEIRAAVLGLLSKYPNIKDYQILETVGEQEEQLELFVEVLYSVLSDLCQIHRGLTGFLENRDQRSLLEGVAPVFGPECFNACYQVRELLNKSEKSVALDHHVKATLLGLKDVLRR